MSLLYGIPVSTGLLHLIHCKCIPQGMNYCPTGLTFSPFLFCGELRLWKSVVYTLYDVHDGLKPSPV